MRYTKPQIAHVIRG